MADLHEASSQYGDMKGQASIDGYFAPPLSDIARDKGIDLKGYFPVGLDLYLDNTFAREGKELRFHGAILAADTGLEELKHEELVALGKRDGHLRVFKFRFEMTLDEIRKNFKRVSITVQSRSFEGIRLEVVELPEGE